MKKAITDIKETKVDQPVIKVNLQNKILIFIGSQFCYYDLLSKKWDIGDVFDVPDGFSDEDGRIGGSNMVDIPDNSGITYLNQTINYSERVPIVVTGGKSMDTDVL